MTAARPQHDRTARPGGAPRAFTLVELLVVIVVMGLLISIIGLVGSQVIHTQKVYRTEATMKAVTMAIDQFALDNPLRGVYDLAVPGVQPRTFGPYPPYQLVNAGVNGAVGGHIDPYGPALKNRLSMDLSAPLANIVIHELNDPTNNDIRALYAYLRFFVPDALEQVPAAALAPLRPDLGAESIRFSSTGVFDVLGIHDAWGVPLDYFLYAKLEFGLDAFGAPGWRVTKRTPVLRSRGVTYEEYKAQIESGEPDPDDWIFSSELPTPFCAAVNRGGGIKTVSSSVQNAQNNGWVRVVGQNEDYKYTPPDEWP